MTTKTVADRASGLGWQHSPAPRGERQQVAKAEKPAMRDRLRHVGAMAAGVAIVLSAVAVLLGATSAANPFDPPSPPDPPSDRDLIRPFPVVRPTPSNWTPKFPFPYDQTRNRVTDADITAMREMCQWYSTQYATLRDQIDRIQFNRINESNGWQPVLAAPDWDYSVNGIQQQVDIVTGNLDESLAFLDPRVHALTQAQNSFGDNYFPIYKGEEFFKLWEQLSNVDNGIKAHQADWFTGPSVQKAKRWGSDIHRSHVCG